MQKIIIADDEARIRKLVSDFLRAENFEPLEAEDGEQALEQYEANRSDVVLVMLDIMMDGYNGWEVCKRIRETSNVPVIILTARSQEFDELMGYESGADDYVTKPFSPTVLMKRVHALLRRADGHFADVVKRNDSLVIVSEAHEVRLDGKSLDLTLKEYSILQKLMEAPGRVFSREQLLDSIWGYDYVGDMRTIDSHVARLRTKLGEWGNTHLKTVYGIGYKIEES